MLWRARLIVRALGLGTNGGNPSFAADMDETGYLWLLPGGALPSTWRCGLGTKGASSSEGRNRTLDGKVKAVGLAALVWPLHRVLAESPYGIRSFGDWGGARRSTGWLWTHAEELERAGLEGGEGGHDSQWPERRGTPAGRSEFLAQRVSERFAAKVAGRGQLGARGPGPGRGL